jgi:ABC-type protease/lipase transport system fused ATPase/permease subunit
VNSAFQEFSEQRRRRRSLLVGVVLFSIVINLLMLTSLL